MAGGIKKGSVMKNYKILVKFPTRSRPAKFLNVLRQYIELSSRPDNIDYLISYDADDHSMNASVRNQAMQLAPGNIHFDVGYSANKIHACNRGIEKYRRKWDIIILASDDMHCQIHGWDDIIRKEMFDSFPDTDGCLWFWDGDNATLPENGRLCTMNIMGRKIYDRFGYLYHPSYLSLWADNEYHDTMTAIGKLKFNETVLFKHIHFSNTPGEIPDQLMKQTQGFFEVDKRNYFERKKINFGLKI